MEEEVQGEDSVAMKQYHFWHDGQQRVLAHTETDLQCNNQNL